MPHRIIIINGPNINLLGEREQSLYGKLTFSELKKECLAIAQKENIEIEFYQSNVEGEIVTKIQESRNHFDGIIINAAGFTHSSVSIRDALEIIKKPKIELHISNIYKREEFRQKSLISDVVDGIICGLGTNGYILAINAMQELLKNGNR
tara:strand:+ start:236 stop:685 length:450 start_codon:yes stop_codon:yes gene_type:complete